MLDFPTIQLAQPLDDAAPVRTSSGGLMLSPIPASARLSLRLRDENTIARLGEAFGVPLPRDACRFQMENGRRALWLGPDEWLLVVPQGDGPTVMAELEPALAGTAHSLVDVSHRAVGFTVSGPDAAALINSGCPLDFSERAFPVGMATRTVLGKTEIILQRLAITEFQIDVWRSFASYAWDYLVEAARDFT